MLGKHKNICHMHQFIVSGSSNNSFIPLRIAKLSGLQDLSFDLSLREMERSTQLFASEMQADRRLEGRSKEAASAHNPSYISREMHDVLCLRFQFIINKMCAKASYFTLYKAIVADIL